MSREVVFLRWCSVCESDGNERVEAVSSWTIGLVESESSRPMLRVLDVCEEHAERMQQMCVMVAKHSIPFDPKASPPPSKQPALKPPPSETSDLCRFCDVEFYNRGTLISHVWNVHRPGERRPSPPTVCPDCRMTFEHPNGMGIHRVRKHGFDALEHAYAGATA